MSRSWVASVAAPIGSDGKYAGWSPCIAWCQENLYHGGHYEPDWDYHGEGVFVFEKEQDYLMFMLRWQ